MNESGRAEVRVVMRPEPSSNISECSSSSPSPSPSPPPSTPASASASGKRSRDPEDEVYLDNFHSHKRYLSEIMASSLNGLTVGDPLPDNLMESPARSETMFYARDDMPLEYSPMSEDSDDSRFCENPINTFSSQHESTPSSPVSPYRYQRPLTGFPSTCSTSSHPSHSCALTNFNCSQSRQRGSDSEGRFPSSPSDICHSADLRRAALLRSVQMRTQPIGPPSFELTFGSGHSIEGEERPCSYMKSLVDERDYQIGECSSMGISDPDFKAEKSCRMMNMDVKGTHSAAD